MNAKFQIRRRSLRLKNKPMRHLEQREDPELTASQKHAIVRLLTERIYIPVLNGKVPVRAVLTPAGG
jgi:hypothetical protein